MWWSDYPTGWHLWLAIVVVLAVWALALAALMVLFGAFGCDDRSRVEPAAPDPGARHRRAIDDDAGRDSRYGGTHD